MTMKRRVQFIFPEQTIEKLDRLKEQMGASSRTEVLKIALELLHWAVARLARGEEIAAVRDDEISETIAIPSGSPRKFSG
jgi:metal-responsive CopG/Arc/MetJ family transcriptional regulator